MDGLEHEMRLFVLRNSIYTWFMGFFDEGRYRDGVNLHVRHLYWHAFGALLLKCRRWSLRSIHIGIALMWDLS